MFRIMKKVLLVFTITTLVFSNFSGIANAATPTVPTNLAATADTESVVLTWTASSNTPTDYIIEYAPNNFINGAYTRFIDAIGTATTATVTGLTNNQLYYFRVKATNNDGTSDPSTVAFATPYSNHTPNDPAVFDACPASIITSAGFTDTTSPDVACVKYYGITKGTTETTFSPLDPVSRWQMALFLTRMVVPTGKALPSGTDQGFSDISGKSAEIQTAINQIKQLGITVGKTATTFAPDAYVTREEMALFLTRLLKAVPAGPGGNEETATYNQALKEIKSLDTDHNFTDLSDSSLMETINSVVNLWNLGVTEVATATKYQPKVNISRINMAQMMANALDHTNARPAGLQIQSSSYTASASGVTTISMTHRTADFLPIANSLVDTFRFQQNVTGSQAFNLNGQCAQAIATEASVTHCYIDSTEKKTDANGNTTTFITGMVAGSKWDYYAWTAVAGTTYDNDLHLPNASKITILG